MFCAFLGGRLVFWIWKELDINPWMCMSELRDLIQLLIRFQEI